MAGRSVADRLQIRPAAPGDTDLLAELGARTFRDTFERQNEPADVDAYLRASFAPERVRAEIEDPAGTLLLAFADGGGQPIGYARLRAGEPDPSVTGAAPVEIERLYVRREVIGHGVGAALMRACLEEAALAGYETIWLGVWERNERAIAFYRRWGFVEVGHHVFTLGSDPQNDLIMERRCR